MKTQILSFLLMLATGIGYAQKNLREGIVITLSGDTLQGNIEYRTDAMNAKQCVFYTEGATEAKTYLPGEISAYRFLDNGRYYVSRTIPSEDKLSEQTFFFEFLVRGQMSVYYLPDAVHGNGYFFENQEGKLAIGRSTPRNATKEERRQALGDAYAMLTGGAKAQKMLWEKDLNPGNVTQITAAYNDEVCPDGQCEIFKYRTKETPKADRTFHWTASAGFTCYQMKRNEPLPLGNASIEFTDKETIPAMMISGGVDVYLPRFCKGFLLQANLDYVRASASIHYRYSWTEWTFDVPEYYSKSGKLRYTANDVTLKFGPAYQFQSDKVQPRLRMGLCASLIWDDYVTDQRLDIADGPVYWGKYFGAGLVFPCKKGAILADFEYASHGYFQYDISKFSFIVGYQF